MYDFLIVGSGLFGAVCGYELTKKGYSCLVIDKRNHVGGNVYTENIEGINVHVYGAHIFHTSKQYIWDYVNQFAQFNGFINSPLARYKKEIYNLPFNMNTFSKLWSDVFTPDEAKNKIEIEKREYHFGDPKNLEEQAISLVGSTIYKKLIEGYTAKQWGRRCSELPPFIIRRIPVRFIYNNNYFDDAYQGIPIGGYTQIVNTMLKECEVRLNCNFLKHRQELSRKCKKIIYTGQIDEFFDYIYGPLEYRSLRFERETLDMVDFQGNAVVNYTEFEVPYTRIIEHKHFEFDHQSPRTIITKEYPSSWKAGDEPYYPINDQKNTNLFHQYEKEAASLPNVFFRGRLGQYKYYDMDRIVEEALAFVNGII